MKWTSLNELREKFLCFFESKGHLRIQGFPLIPQGDDSILLINSGMAPLKPYFTGQAVPPSKRAATCQKCIRTPDIERVGKTSRHGTYFEMLGNFSFGDYFKTDAIKWAWEFVTKTLEIPLDRLWVSIYLEDDQAHDIWVKETNISPDRIVRLGKADNFWEIGSGPCGPCSEIYFDRGEDAGCGSPDCKLGCDCDRYVEFWNLVFTQFNNDGQDNYTPLKNPNIDTGMGLERLACIMQGVDSIFEVDTLRGIRERIYSIQKQSADSGNKTGDVSLKIITDHIRSIVFMISDGVMPSNEGRGYVLRRILRRAARHGRLIGINEVFLADLAETVIELNKNAYPDLPGRADFVKKIILTEEENFIRTLEKGSEMLSDILDGLESEGREKIISGEAAFRLYDTYGFPIELITEISAERGASVDQDGFARQMQEQKQRARQARESDGGVSWENSGFDFVTSDTTEFVGYDSLETSALVQYIIIEGEKADQAVKGGDISLIFDKTTLYAESGGQASDRGVAVFDGGEVEITDLRKLPSGHILHSGIVTKGAIKTGESCSVSVDRAARMATARNHTAAHLLQGALRNVLGTHVHQAGQQVDANRVRFDFNHHSPVTSDQLTEIANQINDIILDDRDVKTYETDMDSAIKAGAIALFSEKYDSKVRVVEVDGYSAELCGGTHVKHTSQLGMFVIISESSVSAGIRRIEAVTGQGVLSLLQSKEQLLNQAAAAVKLQNPLELPKRCTQMSAELKELSRRLEEINRKAVINDIDSLQMNAKEIAGCKVISVGLSGLDSDTLRVMNDRFKDKMPNGIGLIINVTDGKGQIAALCGKEAVALGAHAGKLASQAAAVTGGKGGGRPDFAMAGVGDIGLIDKALSEFEDMVKKQLLG
ncbi:MAG: alanine--tRNA ligase [Oscillospiraceae bacterium]|nr:alanine--tRNA ligase [Oscillospiraceae bacterium]